MTQNQKIIAKGIDCANPLTSDKANAMYENGMRFVCRYLVPTQYAWKRLGRKEAEAITAAGMKIVSVFQRGKNDAAGGEANGVRDGKAALYEARLIGQPTGTAIYFAVDYDAPASDFDVIEAYLRAAGTELNGEYHVGVYGSYYVVEEMAKRGACTYFWQTYAWSRSNLSSYADLYQYRNGQTIAGHQVDLNDAYDDAGWWDTKTQTPAEHVPAWKRQDHDELRAAGFLFDDHTEDLDKPVPQWMLFALINRIRKSERVYRNDTDQ